MTSAGYGIILADPAWSYRNEGVEGSARGEYDTLTTAGIAALGDVIAPLCAKDCVVIIWGTWPLLPDALRVMAGWGFDYVTGFPWIKTEGDPRRSLFTGEYEYKPQYGTGFWIRGTSEYYLVGRRGKPDPSAAGDFVGLVSENFFHSRKPQNIYEYAESFAGPRMELFARRTRIGWTSIGNEIDGKDIRVALTDLNAQKGP